MNTFVIENDLDFLQILHKKKQRYISIAVAIVAILVCFVIQYSLLLFLTFEFCILLIPVYFKFSKKYKPSLCRLEFENDSLKVTDFTKGLVYDIGKVKAENINISQNAQMAETDLCNVVVTGSSGLTIIVPAVKKCELFKIYINSNCE